MMLQYISEKMVEKAICNDVISSDDKELYTFAYQTLLSRVVSWGTFLVLGLLFGCLLGTICFMIMFIPLRIFSGGYHEKSYGQCYFTSVVMFLIYIFLYSYLSNYFSNILIATLITFSLILVYFLSPMEDENKPLELDEVKKYRKYSRLIAVLEYIVVNVLMFFNINREFLLFSLFAMLTVGLLLLLSKYKLLIKTQLSNHQDYLP